MDLFDKLRCIQRGIDRIVKADAKYLAAAADRKRAAGKEQNLRGEARCPVVGCRFRHSIGQAHEIDLRGLRKVAQRRLTDARSRRTAIDNATVIAQLGKFERSLNLACRRQIGSRQRRTATGARDDSRQPPAPEQRVQYGRGRVQIRDRPCAPSTGMHAPVIQLARGEASISTAYATSSGRPSRPAGRSWEMKSFSKAGFALNSVSQVPPG